MSATEPPPLDLNAANAVSIDRVVTQQRRRLERLVAGVLDRSEAEDVVQEALIRLGADPVRHRPYPEVASWLRRACLNLHSTAGGTWALATAGRQGRSTELASRPHQPDEEWLATEKRGGPGHSRHAVRTSPGGAAARYSGYSYAEVAASLEMPLSSVGATLARAESAFRTRYEEQPHDLS